jgi:hypothetical protein
MAEDPIIMVHYIEDALDELEGTPVGDMVVVQGQHRRIKQEVEALRKEVERLRLILQA